MKYTQIEISPKTIITFIGIFVFFILFPYLKYVLILLFVSFIIMSALEPLVNRLAKIKIPRIISVLLAYLIILLLFGTIIFLVVSSVSSQSQSIVKEIKLVPTNLGNAFPIAKPFLHSNEALSLFNNAANQLKMYSDKLIHNFSGIYTTALGVVNVLTSIIAIFVMSIYMLIDKDRNNKMILHVFPYSRKKRISNILNKIETQLGGWLIGQFSLSIIISLVYYAVLSIMQIKYALPIAILGGFFELIPVVGPILTAILILVSTIIFSPAKLIYVIIASFLIQELEAHVLVPNIMNRVIGISPLITIASLILGSELLGITGTLLAVPVAAVVQILLEDIIND